MEKKKNTDGPGLIGWSGESEFYFIMLVTMIEQQFEGFIKNEQLYILEEYHRDTDLLNLDKDKEIIEKKLNFIQKSCIVGVIGKLGSGKTTLINQVSKKMEKEGNILFLKFEARKYPGRKDLWENFVLEVADQLGKKTQFIKKIDGTQNEDKKTLVTMLKNLPGSWSKYIPGLDSIEQGILHFLQTSPATRIFQLEELLTELLNSVDKERIHIVVEDADRAGSEGIFFLETLNYFLKETYKKKVIIAIALIGEENYKKSENLLSFQKCIDLRYDFHITDPGFDDFVETLFVDKVKNIQHLKGQISSFLRGIFKSFDEISTMRQIKLILRNANIHYQHLVSEQGDAIDVRLCILSECAKHVSFPSSPDKTYFDTWKHDRAIKARSGVFGALLKCIADDNHAMRQYKVSSVYEETSRGQPEKFRQWNGGGDAIKIIDEDYIGLDDKSKNDAMRYITDTFGGGSYFAISKIYFD